MSVAATETAETAKPDDPRPAPGDLFGHPRGLSVLFATEMWERFSYFGMTAILALYLLDRLPQNSGAIVGFAAVKAGMEHLLGPLELQPFVSQLTGLFTGLAYLAPLLGGYLADRYVGQRMMAVIGALMMAAGHFLMAFEPLLFFALGLLILGMGAFKPNVSTQVGSLYAEEDRRRERAYSIYYFGINIGAFVAPYVCGTLGEKVAWHYGFAAAGVGMLVATAIYLHGLRWLPPDELHRTRAAHIVAAPLSPHDKRAVAGLIGVFALVVFFWATYDQVYFAMVSWTNAFTDRVVHVGGRAFEIPASWFPSLNPLMIFILTPLVIWAWRGLALLGREPSDVAKMAFAFFCVAAANLLLVVAALLNPGAADKASPLWLVGYYFIGTLGELHLAPVGLALVSRLAPGRALSLMMGLWLAATFPGDLLGGRLGGLWVSMSKPHLFALFAGIAAAAGVAMFALSPVLKRSFEE